MRDGDHYAEFLTRKHILDVATGFEPSDLSDALFDFQRDIVRWACRRGRAALFEDCGLGKTLQQLVWADAVVKHTGKKVLILAPIGVAQQTIREGERFGIEVHHAKSSADVIPGINITNYEKLHRFDLSEFVGIVLDESSILKSYSGATRNAIITSAARLPYKLACTATPAPNDFMELGNHAEFLGVMSRSEMLSTFFVHDGGDTSKWRLKGHAESEFWRWVCSWAVSIRHPSDLGYDDGKFLLPPLNLKEHVLEVATAPDGELFPVKASTLNERRAARRVSLVERVDHAAALANGSRFVFWCNLNSESEAIAKAADATEIRGNTSEDEREEIISGFISGQVKRVVTKGSIWGFGLNLQCCHNTAFVGLSDSYEEFYQIVRRFWRFGQVNPVNAHIVISDAEVSVLQNIKRKEQDASKMQQEMVQHMAAISSDEIRATHRTQSHYKPTVNLQLPGWLK